MGRRPTYTPELAARVADLAGAGMSAEAIHAKLRAEGERVPSVRTVGTLARRARAGKAPARKRGERKPRGSAPQAAEPPTEALVSTLQGAVDTMNRIAAEIDLAQADASDVKLLNQTFRTLSQVAAQIQRMTPPEPPDPNAHPDMLAAAARGREKLAAYVEKIRSGK